MVRARGEVDSVKPSKHARRRRFQARYSSPEDKYYSPSRSYGENAIIATIMVRLDKLERKVMKALEDLSRGNPVR
jgi:hypothetical protein